MAKAPTITDVVEAQVVTRKIPRPGVEASRIDKLRKIVEKHSDATFHIVIAQIDPDAVGSAFGMYEVLTLCGATSIEILYSGVIAHPQNEAICNKFNLLGKMKKITDLDSDPGGVVLVDSCLRKDSRLPFEVDPLIVVDHHRDSDVVESSDKFLWLDDEAGSAATLVLELLSELGGEGWEFRPDLAIMLALGVYTDTKDLVNSHQRDSDAYGWAARYAPTADLKKLIQYNRPMSYLKLLAAAVESAGDGNFRDGRVVASLGHIAAKHGDYLAMIADEFLRTTGVVMAITWAVVEQRRPDGEIKKNVRLCARSDDITLNLNQFLRERFGTGSGAKTLPDGVGEGGALVELELGPWLRESEMIEVVSRRIKEWVFGEEDADDVETK